MAYSQTDFTTDTGTEYKTKIDDNFAELDGAATSGGGNFPNVDADVTATAEQMNAVLTTYETATVELGGDFNAGEEVKCVRIGDLVIVSAFGNLDHASGVDRPTSSQGVIPSQFRPTSGASVVRGIHSTSSETLVVLVTIEIDGVFSLGYYDQNLENNNPWSFTDNSITIPCITYLIT